MLKPTSYKAIPEMSGDDLQSFLYDNGIRKGEFASAIGYSREQVTKWTRHYHDRNVPRAVSISAVWLLNEIKKAKRTSDR